jgi:ankyrin repeat protein
VQQSAVYLFAAAGAGHTAAVAALLQHGATAVMNELGPKLADAHSGAGITALMACKKPGVLQALLAAGADVHKTRPNGDTCLHVAAENRYPSPVLCLLISAGVDPLAVNSAGKTAEQLARASGNTAAALLLQRVTSGPLAVAQ